MHSVFVYICRLCAFNQEDRKVRESDWRKALGQICNLFLEFDSPEKNALHI